MATVRRRRDGRWVIVRQPLHRTIGRAFLVTVAGLALVLGFLVDREDAAFPWVAVVAFGLPGLLYLRTGRPVLLDAEVGIIDLGQGFERGTSFLSVTLSSEVRNVRDQDVRLYTVALDRCGEGSEGPASITETEDERAAWQVSELLAKALDLPVLDTSSGRPMRRTPAQLDQSLEERLASAEVPPEDPGPPPSGIHAEQAPGRLRLSWRAPRARVVLGLVVLLAFIAMSGWVAIDLEKPGLGVMLGGLGVTLLVMLLMNARGIGTNVLEVGPHQVRYCTSFPLRRVDTIARRSLEHARDQSTPRPSVSLITDDRVLELAGSPAQCRWIRRKLEHWLATAATELGDRAHRGRKPRDPIASPDPGPSTIRE